MDTLVELYMEDYGFDEEKAKRAVKFDETVKEQIPRIQEDIETLRRMRAELENEVLARVAKLEAMFEEFKLDDDFIEVVEADTPIDYDGNKESIYDYLDMDRAIRKFFIRN